jgi:hypothetical protein
MKKKRIYRGKLIRVAYGYGFRWAGLRFTLPIPARKGIRL